MTSGPKTGLVPTRKEHKFKEPVSFSPLYTVYSLENQLKTSIFLYTFLMIRNNQLCAHNCSYWGLIKPVNKNKIHTELSISRMFVLF